METTTPQDVRMYERDGCLFVRYRQDTYEVPARCPHLGGPLSRGTLTGPFLRCPWHGATFDIRTGSRLRGPDCADLAVRRTST
jgi:nitrite reductase/ring-hydroxylating ferredoxin subunit